MPSAFPMLQTPMPVPPRAGAAPDATPGGAAVPTPERLAGLSRWLRGVGALALCAAASSFLLQHWEGGGDLTRYYTLLAHTAGLAALGFVWGLRSGDAKGARTFLAIAAALVPAHFCLLGGLVYSQLSWDGGLVPVARYATWVAPSAAAAGLAVAATFALLGGVTAVSFLTLARSRARALAWVYLASNALLLVPTREPGAIALLGAAAVAAGAAVEVRWVRRDAALRTLEGRFVRVMLAAPVVLVLVRSALHYDLSAAYGAVVSTAIGLSGFALAGEWRLPPALGSALRAASLVAFAAASGFAGVCAVSSFGVPEAVALPAAGLAFGALACALSLAAGAARWGVVWRGAAAWAVLGSVGLDLWLHPGVAASIAGLATAVVALGYGHLTGRRGILWAGAGGAALAIASHLQAAVHLYALHRWGSLALAGVGVILVAALVERRGEACARWLGALRRRIASESEEEALR